MKGFFKKNRNKREKLKEKLILKAKEKKQRQVSSLKFSLSQKIGEENLLKSLMEEVTGLPRDMGEEKEPSDRVSLQIQSKIQNTF